MWTVDFKISDCLSFAANSWWIWCCHCFVHGKITPSATILASVGAKGSNISTRRCPW